MTCADGTTSEAGRGACSHHGGVAKTRAPRKAPKRAPADDRVRVDRDRADPEATSKVPPPAPALVVRCTDGSVSPKGRGACSHHGGVASDAIEDRLDRRTRDRVDTRDTQARPAPKREPRTNRPWWGSDEPMPGDPLARCNDGSLSYSKHHRGTCSNHGGVRDWLDD